MDFNNAMVAAKKIVLDLTDRRGLKQAWYETDEEIQSDIEEGWANIMVETSREALEKMKKPHDMTKHSHGVCCYCSTCRWPHEECVCDWNDQIDEMITKLKTSKSD